MRNRTLLRSGLAFLALLLAGPVALTAAPAPQDLKLDIPYQKFTFSNGLTVLVHEDHKAPIVAVNIWYHVGSKNEKRGKTGFAHLFEHLMFNGSEHFNDDYFKVLEKLGATDLNGTTSEDRTNYFQNVPTSALDTVLWMESDRMGHLVGVIDQPRLDEQRGVVQNEKRQGENQPYGLAYTMLPEYSYPQGHPYSWSVIGSMEDLTSASLADVKEWFRTYYGPSNATLVIAGDIDAATARAKVEQYFGAIPPGPPVPRYEQWISPMSGNRRAVLEDRVPQVRVIRVWNVPPPFTQAASELEMAGRILAQGRNSRLYRRLVLKDQTATDVNFYIDPKEIGAQFFIEANAQPGIAAPVLEKAIDEELHALLAAGPTAEELERTRTSYIAGVVRGLERIGGFGGKSDRLATAQVFAGDAAAWKHPIEYVQQATAGGLRKTASEWLEQGSLTLEIRPFPPLKASAADADRSKVPAAGAPPALKLPKLQRATLANGLNVILAERHDTPLVLFSLLTPGGWASEEPSHAGAAHLTMDVLDKGTATRTDEEISREFEALGARINNSSSLETCNVALSALKSNLDRSLDLYADVILHPAFRTPEFERERKRLLAGIEQEKAEPFGVSLRLLPALLFGAGHPYAKPFTGSGTAATLGSLTPQSLIEYHRTWFKPNHSTLVIVGDTTMAEMTPKLERLFGSWQKGDVPALNIPTVNQADKPTVYLVDRPGSLQSVILAGQIAPRRATPDEIAFETLNTVLGGAFVSRINMNLREDKHWSYGAGSFLFSSHRGQRPYIVYAPVETGKTRESLDEIRKELHQVLKERPVTPAELAMAQDNETLRMPGSRETKSSVLESIVELLVCGLPDDFYDTYTAKVRALTTRDIATGAEKLLRPDNLVWVVVGDRSKIEKGVRELNLGDVRLIDEDGKPVQ